jgi:hypothetical protein
LTHLLLLLLLLLLPPRQSNSTQEIKYLRPALI